MAISKFIFCKSLMMYVLLLSLLFLFLQVTASAILLVSGGRKSLDYHHVDV